MEKILDQIPKPLVAIIAVSAAAAFLYFGQAPRTICDAERDTFEESLKGELYPEKVSKKRGSRPAEISKAKDYCKLGNSSGACVEYFNLIRNITKSMELLSFECRAPISEAPQVMGTLKESLMLMTQLAWGDTPPADQNQNWFRSFDYSVFCHTREQLKQILEEDDLATLYDSIMQSLPGPKPADEFSAPVKAVQVLPRNEVYRRSILSLRCEPHI